MTRATTQLLTADELARMPEGESRRELVRGELLEMPPAGSEHGGVASRLACAVMAHVYAHKLGECFIAETGFRLASDPDTVRAPDFAFVCADHMPAGGRPTGFFPGAPDLAVEVLSPSDSAEDLGLKIDDYLAVGTQQVWIVSPARRTVTIHRPGIDPQVLREGDTIDGGPLLPGFSVAVSRIFE